ncbi:hypothetical protein ACP70R_041142 [Stipagrostis hirtigluma subsp. patula]
MAPAGGEAAGVEVKEPGFLTRPLTPKQTKVAVTCSVLLVAVVVALLTIFLVVLDPHDGVVFHVRATDVDGLDPAHSPVIRPSFGLALRVDNHGIYFEDCWENVTITVFYGDRIVGWGAVPDFCAGKGASVELNAAMSHTDVVLTDELRGSMASQLRTGGLELEVEMRMLLSKRHIDRNCNSCASRQGFQFCSVIPGRQDYAPCQLVHLLRA